MTTRPSIPSWVQNLHPYVPGKPVEELERELGIRNSVKLASNENPLGPSPLAVEAMQKRLADLHLYPDANAFYLRQKLASHLDVKPGELVFGNGSNEVLTLLIRSLCEPGDEAVVSQYAFVAYRVCLGAAGVRMNEVPAVDLGHDLEAMAAACTERTKLVFVANPNNPTGTFNAAESVRRFLDTVPSHVMVVMDEAYYEYVNTHDYASALTMRGRRENLAVLRTFSKAYGMAGIRFGFGVLPEWAADVVNRVREPFNVSSVAQAGAMAALDDVAFLERSVRINTEVREVLYQGLETLGLPFVRSQTNFVLVESPVGGAALYEALLHKGVITRPLQPYAMPQHLRISIGSPNENERLLQALRECMEALA